LTLSPRQANPAYVPTPKQLAQRFPWVIYLVLGAAVGMLALVLRSLGKTAIAMHDASESPIATA
ncbi:MAG TPA: hypothetical protein VHY20_01285, partial [Pirellulales bacterium]|jgi:hypothetical protein|nr:hypothetical protein [Pirellulales bacterium]